MAVHPMHVNKNSYEEKFLPLGVRLAEELGARHRFFGNTFTEKMKPLLPLLLEMLEVAENIPVAMRNANVILATQGWYVLGDVSAEEFFTAANSLSDGDKETVNKRMADYYRSNADEIKQRLCESNPCRQQIIKSAFAAHESSNFYLSIPIMLIQADGICFDLIGTQLFSKDKKVPRIAAKFEGIEKDSYLDILLECLRQVMPINASESERKFLDNDILNRHAILHGEEINYANETNSLKTISLLHFVSHSICMATRAMDSSQSIEPI